MVMEASIFADISTRIVSVKPHKSMKLKMERIKMLDDRIIKGILILLKVSQAIIIAAAIGI